MTKVHGKPTRLTRMGMHKKCKEISATADISYEWVDNHGLLVDLASPGQYLENTKLVYEEPTKPARTFPNIDKNTPDHERWSLELDQEEAKINWHIQAGHHKAMAKKSVTHWTRNTTNSLRRSKLDTMGSIRRNTLRASTRFDARSLLRRGKR